MAYTNTWDETAPLDTSLASLLGQDIRTFKTDIRERVAQMSGTLANRPTPESVWDRLLYFAIDTGQIFQWTGATGGTNWVDVTSFFIKPPVSGGGGTLFYTDAPGSLNFSTSGSQTIYDPPIPLPPLASGHGLRLKTVFQYTTPSSNVNGAISYGASVIYSFLAAPGILVDLDLIFANMPGSQAQQVVAVTGLANNGGVGGPYAFSLGLDTTPSDNALSFVVQSGSGAAVTGSVLISAWILELI